MVRVSKIFNNIKQKSPASVGFFSFVFLQMLFFFLLQLVSRLIFIFHRGNRDSSFATFLEAGKYGFRLDFSMLSYYLILVLVILVFALAFNKKGILKIAGIVTLFLLVFTCIISFADAEMYKVWGTKFNRQALDYMRSPSEALASSSGAAWGRIAIFTMLIAFSFLWVYGKIVRRIGWTDLKSRLRLIVLSVLFMGVFVISGRGGLQTVPINQSSAYYSNNNFRNLAAVNSAWNFMYFLTEKNEKIEPEKYNYGFQNKDAWKRYLVSDSGAFKISNINKPNVIVVVLESHSAYVSKFFGGVFDNTPFLDSMGRSGWAFTNAYSQGDRTDKGLACVIGGWPGQPWQSILFEPDKAAKLPSLAQAFNENGYHSSFYYGGDLDFANMKAYIRNAGFTQLTEAANFASDEKNSKWGAHDEYVFKRFVADKKTANQPFFSAILTLSSHEPYEVPGQEKTQFKDVQAKFLSSISYTNACLKQFIHNASKEKWFANTLFVFVADHGRDVGLPDMNYSQPKHFKIPIVFWGPALAAEFRNKIETDLVCQTDIGQTLVQNLLDKKAGFFPFGRNLAGKHANSAVYFFSSGFGVLSPNGHVIWENNPPRVTENTGKDTADMLSMGQTLQYELIKRYKKY